MWVDVTFVWPRESSANVLTFKEDTLRSFLISLTNNAEDAWFVFLRKRVRLCMPWVNISEVLGVNNDHFSWPRDDPSNILVLHSHLKYPAYLVQIISSCSLNIYSFVKYFLWDFLWVMHHKSLKSYLCKSTKTRLQRLKYVNFFVCWLSDSPLHISLCDGGGLSCGQIVGWAGFKELLPLGLL